RNVTGVQTCALPISPGIGFGMGLERLQLALEAEKVTLPIDKSLDVFFVAMGDVQKEAVKLVQQLREAGFKVDKDYQDRKMKAQFKAADRFAAKHVVILGENELAEKVVQLRSMETGDQEEVPFDKLIDVMKEKVGGEK